MAYIPKHKINKLIALEGEFTYERGGKPYVGPYIETADRKYYAGEDPYNLLPDNLLKKILPDPTSYSFEDIPQVRIFNLLNKKTKKKIEKVKPIPTSKPKPTKKDYEKFKFTRYFAKRINSTYGYFEIEKEAYDSLKSQKPEYDFSLYIIGTLEWALVGDTQIININTLKEAEKDYPGLSLCFKNLKEYKSTKDPGIFKKFKEWDPYKKEGLTSSQIREAIEYTTSQKDKKSPEKLIDVDNYKLYNIEGRQYPDGVPVPNNLPKAYGLPKPVPKVLIQNQNCLSCYFNKGGLCTYWNANIRNAYWCAAWVGMQIQEITYQEFQDEVTETINQLSNTSTVSSIGDVTLDDQTQATTISSTGGGSSGGGSSGGGGGGY